ISGRKRIESCLEMDDAAYLERVSGNKNIQVICIYKVLKAFFHLLVNDHKTALRLSDEAEGTIYTVGTQGLLPWPEHVFARFLILSALFVETGSGKNSGRREELTAAIDQIRIWADQCQENYAHKLLLAEAEMHRIEKKHARAAVLYDQAIDAAHQNNFLQWEGIACERAYRFWLDLENGRLAQIYWQQAFNCYQIWGAGVKLALMKEEFRKNLDAWFFRAGREKTDGRAWFEKNRQQFAERQIDLMERRSREKLTSLHSESVNRQADELASALERLRVETAERKKAELRLKQNEKRFQKAEKLGKVGNWEYDLQTDEFWGSDQLKRMYGFDPARGLFTKESMESCIRDQKRFQKAMTDLVEKHKPYDLEFEIQPAGGLEKKIIRSAVRLQSDSSGRPVKIAGVIQDITERKKEEAERQKLE
ncbi:MAG: hypothetical protein MI749_16285, partial [Desulfovibrionales bacterium]|nr:hypothetical protein [Desulfovibrionales bacterium]